MGATLDPVQQPLPAHYRILDITILPELTFFMGRRVLRITSTSGLGQPPVEKAFQGFVARRCVPPLAASPTE